MRSASALLSALLVGVANAGPCDIYAAGGTPCVAAHSPVRALYKAYSGALYQVQRSSDSKTLDIKVSEPGGIADAASQDEFCKGTDCIFSTIYDQSGKGNHLTVCQGGGWVKYADDPVNATQHPITVGGKKAYGMWFTFGMGYRNGKGNGVAVGDEAEAIYMVTSGIHSNHGCCFDYGNAETSGRDDGKASMEALNIANWGGNGVNIGVDMEQSTFSCWGSDCPKVPSLAGVPYVTAMVKGRSGGTMAIKQANSQEPKLYTQYDGPRPDDFKVMKKQGAIILGIGGDNSNSGEGCFYEGVLVKGNPSDSVDDQVQADIAAAGYVTPVTLPPPPIKYPKLHEQCGGKIYGGPTQCADGLDCVYETEWRSECRPSSTPKPTTKTPAPTTPTPTTPTPTTPTPTTPTPTTPTPTTPTPTTPTPKPTTPTPAPTTPTPTTPTPTTPTPKPTTPKPTTPTPAPTTPTPTTPTPAPTTPTPTTPTPAPTTPTPTTPTPSPTTPKPTTTTPAPTTPTPTPTCVKESCHLQQVCGLRFDPRTGFLAKITYASMCDLSYEQCVFGFKFFHIHGGPCFGGAKIWERCGGIGWDGPTFCAPGQGVCVFGNEYYSQCQYPTLPPSTTSPAPTQTSSPTPATTAPSQNQTTAPPTPSCELQPCAAQQVCATRVNTTTGATTNVTYASTCVRDQDQCLYGYKFTQTRGGPCEGGAQVWQRCGGIGWDGPTYCAPDQGVCTVGNDYYSQCQIATAAVAATAEEIAALAENA